MTGAQPKLFLFAVIQIKPEHFQEAKADLDKITPPALKYPGFQIFAAFVSKDHSNTLHLIECFDDEDALKFHYAQVYTASFFKKYETWLSAPVKATKISAASRVNWEQFHA